MTEPDLEQLARMRGLAAGFAASWPPDGRLAAGRLLAQIDGLLHGEEWLARVQRLLAGRV